MAEQPKGNGATTPTATAGSTAGTQNKIYSCKVVRLRETKNAQGAYSYELKSGIPADVLKEVRMYGRTAGFENKVFYSSKLKGSVGVETTVDIIILPVQTQAGTINTLVFKRSDEEIKEQSTTEREAGEFFSKARVFGVDRAKAGEIAINQLASNLTFGKKIVAPAVADTSGQ